MHKELLRALPTKLPVKNYSLQSWMKKEHNVSANLAVDLNVQHTYIGDLKVVLTSPTGTQVVLHANSDGSTDNIVGRYPTTLTPAEALSKFLGEPVTGDWKLSIVDSAAQDTGSLVSWGLYDVAGYECQQ